MMNLKYKIIFYVCILITLHLFYCSAKFGRKMMYVNYLEELAQYINLDQLIIPPQVLQ